MSLDWQLVDIKFQDGLDTRTQKKLTLPGKWRTLNNVTLASDNSTRKRDGYSPLIFQRGNGLATFNNEVLLIQGPTVWGIYSNNGTEAALVAGSQGGGFAEYGYVNVQKTEVRRSSNLQDSVDCAYGAGMVAYVWRDLSSTSAYFPISCSIIDEATGSVLLNSFAITSGVTSGMSPRVVYSNGAFFFLWVDVLNGALMCAVVDVTAPSVVGTPVALFTNPFLSINQNIDACAFADSLASSVLVSYVWSDGVASVVSRIILRAGTVPSTGFTVNTVAEANAPNAHITALCCAAYTNTVRAGVFCQVDSGAASPGVWGSLLSSAFALLGSTRVDAIVSPTPGLSHIAACAYASNLCVFYDQRAAINTAALKTIRRVDVDSNLTPGLPGAVASSATFDVGVAAGSCGPQGPFIHGKPFATSSSQVLLPVAVLEAYSLPAPVYPATASRVNLNIQNSFFVLDGRNGTVVGKALYGTLGAATWGTSFVAVAAPCSTPSTAADKFLVAVPERTRLLTSDGVNVSPTGICRLSLLPNNTTAPVKSQLGQELFLAGGSLTGYDSATVCEHGFNLFPEGIACVAANTGLGSVTAGIHQVVAVYEWIDAAGQRHQSAPSLASTVSMVGPNDTINVRIPSLLLTQKQGVKIALYITQAAGLAFNRVTVYGGVTSPEGVNNNASSFETSTDIRSSDASLASNELLYNQPNQANTTLPNTSPGPCSALAVHQNRLWVNADDSPLTFRYSQQSISGVGLQFSDGLGGQVDVSGGRIVGFCSLDEKVIVFCSRKPFAIYGVGPNAAGGYNNYSDPQEVPSDVGCSDVNSILRIPPGIIFKSLKGWYLLGRDLTVRYIGEGVQAYDANDVTSAVMVATEQECRFSSTSGVTLVYNYLSNQWSTYSVAGDAYAVVDAIWAPALTKYLHLSLREGLNQTIPGQQTDTVGNRSAAGIVSTYQTSWLHVSRIGGFQRARWLYLTASADSPPTSTLSVAVDFDDTDGNIAPGSYTTSIILSGIGLSTGQPVDLRHKLRRQKCKSLSFTFTEGGVGVSLTGIQALVLQCGMRKGTNKLPAAQSLG